MSQQAPEPRETLHAIAHAVYILKTPSNFSETVMLFSINDGEWMAWYRYAELVFQKRAREEFDANLEGDHHISLVEDWTDLHSKTFKPSKPRRVDEFAPADGDYGRALLLKPVFQSEFITLNLYLFGLKDGDQEHFPLKMHAGKKPKEMPANREPGVVQLLDRNPFNRNRSAMDPSRHVGLSAYLGPAVK